MCALIRASRTGLLTKCAWVWKPSKQVSKLSCTRKYGTESKYLHNSTLPTYYYQDSIPSLPIPQLEKTCERYIRGITPLFEHDQLETTKKIVDEFCNGEGQRLQRDLEEYAKNHPDKSYMSDPWFDMYINAREPLPLNFSAGMQFSDDPRPGYMDPAIRSTNIIMSTLKFMLSLEAEILHPYVVPAKPNKGNADMVRNVPIQNKGEAEKIITAIPVCMSQFKQMFKATRIPKKDHDVLKKSPKSRHMSAMRNGYFYTFDVLDEAGDPLPATTVLSSIRKILEDTRPPNPHPLGILTTQNRDLWADLREQLEGEAGNAEAFDQVDSGIFMMVFDDDVMENSAQLTRNFLHGTGTNRWFDKSFQIVVTKNGKVGKILEHSWGDGMTGIYYGHEMHKDILSQPAVAPDVEAGQEGAVRKIEFSIPESVKEAIAASVARYDLITDKLELNHVYSEMLGKDLAKSAKLSPDALAQLGMQMAFHKTHGCTPPTYESCSTAIFKYGRTETLRSATIETKEFSQMMEARVEPSRQDLLQALRKCSDMHRRLAAEATVGQGFDRHLFGLRHLVQRQGGIMPKLFMDPSYAGSCQFRLSTSTLGAQEYLYMGAFGPVVPDGYGITYMVGKENTMATVSSYRDNQLDGFCDALKESWKQINGLLQD